MEIHFKTMQHLQLKQACIMLGADPNSNSIRVLQGRIRNRLKHLGRDSAHNLNEALSDMDAPGHSGCPAEAVEHLQPFDSQQLQTASPAPVETGGFMSVGVQHFRAGISNVMGSFGTAFTAGVSSIFSRKREREETYPMEEKGEEEIDSPVSRKRKRAKEKKQAAEEEAVRVAAKPEAAFTADFTQKDESEEMEEKEEEEENEEEMDSTDEEEPDLAPSKKCKEEQEADWREFAQENCKNRNSFGESMCGGEMGKMS